MRHKYPQIAAPAVTLLLLVTTLIAQERQRTIFDFGQDPARKATTPAATAPTHELHSMLIAVDLLAWCSRLDVSSFQLDMLEQLTPAAGSAARSRAIAELAAKLCDRRIAREDIQRAVQFASLAERAARATKDPAFARAATTRSSQVRFLQSEWVAASVAMQRLRSNPTDAEAKLTLGKFYCLTRGLFDRGLPLLAAGVDEKLRKLAQRDLDAGSRAKRDDADEALAVGQAWWEYSEGLEGTAMTLAQMRAAHCYKRGVAKLIGWDKAIIEKRIASTPAQPPFPPPLSPEPPLVLAGADGVVAKAMILVSDDFVMDLHHNGKLVPAEQRKLLGEHFGAQVERVTIDLKPGDWVVFNVANNRLRWKGAYYFAAAGLDAEGTCVFASETTSGQWSANDDLREAPEFIARRDHLHDRKAQKVTRPWDNGDKVMLQRVPDFKGEGVWGDADSRSTWVKFIVPGSGEAAR